MYLVPELLEGIFLRLPLKSIVKFKTVSKQWRSILESRRFMERRRIMNAQTKTKIVADLIPPIFKGDEELEMVYLQCDVDSEPSLLLSCDGLVCIPVRGWVIVFNPSTGESRRFSSGRDPRFHRYAKYRYSDCLCDDFPGYWRMGFGGDNVSGSYKIVRMFFNHYRQIYCCCEILDVKIGAWQKLNPPPYDVGLRRKSTCVNGSIYWVKGTPYNKLLALDLHTLEWRDVGLPLGALGTSCQVANLENRLALADSYIENNHWNVKIWSMEAPEEVEETWSVIYSIPLLDLAHPDDNLSSLFSFWIMPVAVSKNGNLFFHDNYESLFKYYRETGEVRLIAAEISVITPFIENLVPLGGFWTAKHINLNI
ncbi:unnamed protein product [Eruca vesicaria subsp. sativa]|uniref:F-box domain-containing protein n=1 Tax=Eruca vesicaria subsp. sativa TaxID=29727 RepID=A0ABC8KYW4_ERUVS|nr:unnamed protein product [Eruca vesicaria subsp. sativa]